ncbi:tetratricopeptide repeat protein [Brevundimonas diminuta]|uniref:tetratricopeptide repeat protein n=1 Tax=Brevundimonas diminuta TaxID=293 RepID=UPI0030F916C0
MNYADDEERCLIVNPVGAYEWFRTAVETGDPECLWRMGVLHAADFPWLGHDWADRIDDLELELKLEAMSAEALEWYHRAAENSPKHMVRLADAYAFGDLNLSPDPDEAFSWYQRAAGTGDGAAMVSLAHWYEGALGLTPSAHVDHAEALNWYRRAAETGDAGAMNRMAALYEEGRLGLPRDDAEALAWIRRAATTRDPRGMAAMAYLFEHGRLGLPQDDAEALAWHRRAADTGDAIAMLDMAYLYEEGNLGLRQDYHEALAWYRRASEAGDVRGMKGAVAIHAEGPLADNDEARRWLRRAAETGDTESMWELGDSYLTGRFGQGVNRTFAFAWQRNAASLDLYDRLDLSRHPHLREVYPERFAG